MDRQHFEKALDLQQPDWWITFATEQDRIDYMRAPDKTRAESNIRHSVSMRLMIGPRAAVHSGFLIEKELTNV